MFFELFLFLVALISVLGVYGFWKKSIAAAVLAALLLILLGGLLFTEGIVVEAGSHISKQSTGYVVSYDMNTLLPVNDASVRTMANLFLYGGFAFLVLSLVLFFVSRG